MSAFLRADWAQRTMRARDNLADGEASQLVEFAVALPLLVVLVVGIFDFGQALNLKQELNNAVREGARLGSMQPTNDLSQTTPASVVAIRDLVDSYLKTAGINDCGLGGASPPPLTSGGTLIWTETANAGCVGSLTLTIDRGYLAPIAAVGGNPASNLVCTRVTISYPYSWRFNRVIGFLVRGASYSTTLQIGTDAAMPNMD